MSSGLSVVEEAALTVLFSLSPSQRRRLKRERQQYGPGYLVPARALTELLDALEWQYPGLVARVASNLEPSRR